jgi:hypothetical protein
LAAATSSVTVMPRVATQSLALRLQALDLAVNRKDLLC